MNELTNDVLAYTRVARAEFPLATMKLDDLVDDAVTQSNLAAPEVQLQIDRPLGQVIGNRILLSQCLNNLLDNAVKYAHPNRPLNLRLRVERNYFNVRLFVQDNGLGIPIEHQSRIFRIFERVELKQPGTGVGLAIVKRAVDRMNGKLGVNSEPDRGSTFWIELPAAK